MKTAIYIEDGTVQLVITPETEFEKNAMKTFGDSPLEAEMFRGAFCDCRGGWVRQKKYYPDVQGFGSDRNDADTSLIVRVSKPLPPPRSDPC